MSKDGGSNSNRLTHPHTPHTHTRNLDTQTGTEEEAGELFYEAQEQVPHIVDDTPNMVWLNGGPGCTHKQAHALHARTHPHTDAHTGAHEIRSHELTLPCTHAHAHTDGH